MGNGRERFTYRYYLEFICLLREAYTCITFQEGREIGRGRSTGLMILRHDVDMDLESAVRLSSLEKECGVNSTYFFMVSSQLYNVCNREGRRRVQEILNCGHCFGLHFDCAAYEDMSLQTLNAHVLRECQVLEDFFGRSIQAVSFHRPGPFEMNDIRLDRLPHAYEPLFRERFEYFSDSRGVWARGNPIASDAFTQGMNLHLCIHPIWWSEEPKDEVQCLVDFFSRNTARNDDYLGKTCQVWRREQERPAQATPGNRGRAWKDR